MQAMLEIGVEGWGRVPGKRHVAPPPVLGPQTLHVCVRVEGLRVWGLGCRVWGLGRRVFQFLILGFKV